MKVFSSWNSTKMMFHLSKHDNPYICNCPSKKIDKSHQETYGALLTKYLVSKKKKEEASLSQKRKSDSFVAAAGNALLSSRKKKKVPTDFFSSPTPTERTSTKNARTSATVGNALQTPHTNPNRQFHQLSIGDAVSPSSEACLTMAIADFIHSCGLPFAVASHHKFRRVLTLAKTVSTNYIPPSRRQIGGELLDMNYSLYKKEMITSLERDTDIFGIAFFGDGATIKKSPLINILASSSHLPVGCLQIVDCSGHMSSSGKKDAQFIASLFLPHIAEMEQKIPNSTDLVIFDGASNVQKAGKLLAAQFPRIAVIHGAEHVISLFFQDVFKLPEFEVLRDFNRTLYRFFGSGSMHGPYAIFSKHSRDHNGGKSIGFIRAADTRMAGHVISMLRTLRLKPALLSTISSAAFLQGRFEVRMVHGYRLLETM